MFFRKDWFCTVDSLNSGRALEFRVGGGTTIRGGVGSRWEYARFGGWMDCSMGFAGDSGSSISMVIRR